MTELKNQTEKKSFASRWSKRKQQVKLEQDTLNAREDNSAGEIAEAGVPGTEPASTEQIRAEKLAQLNALKDEDMPDIASLNEDSDFSQFMSINVSEKLRKLALRKLFQGETYNIRDGLDEYDGDYTSFEKLDPGTITADMKYRREFEAEKLRAQLEKEETDEIEAFSNDDSATQQEADGTHDEPTEIEDHNEADSSEKLQQRDEQARTQTDIKQAELEQSAGQITKETSGENQT